MKLRGNLFRSLNFRDGSRPKFLGVDGEQSEPLGVSLASEEGARSVPSELLMKMQVYTSLSLFLPKNLIEASIKHPHHPQRGF